jgi:alpha-tubulin suppressor-like RCC1 family protein
VLSAETDRDVFRFVTGAGSVTLTGMPVAGGNADLRLELLDGSGAVLASADPATEVAATLTHTVGAGTFFARVSAAGAGDPLGAPPSGYTAYGSVGQYALHLAVAPRAPVLAEISPLTVPVGHEFQRAFESEGYVATFTASGLPNGLTLDPISGVVSGRPLEVGAFAVTVTAANAEGSSSRTFTLTVADAAPVVLAQTRGMLTPIPGEVVTLSIDEVLSPSGAVSYRWMRDGRPVAGSESATLTLPPASRTTGGAYWAEVSNLAGVARSSPVFVRVAPEYTKVTGWSSEGVMAVPGGLGRVVQVAGGGGNFFALRADGAVFSWTTEMGAAKVVARGVAGIAATRVGTFLLMADGTLDRVGEVDLGPTAGPTRDVYAVDAADYMVVARRTDGSAFYLASTNYTPNPGMLPVGVSNLVSVAGGGNAWAGLKPDGRVVTWSGSTLNLSAPPGLAGVKAISGGGTRVVALKEGGTTVAWGYGGEPAPQLLPDAVALAVHEFVSLALNADGTLVSWKPAVANALPPADLRAVWNVAVTSGQGVAVSDAGGTPPPVIVTPPAGATRAVGAAHRFSVAATGTGPLGYQWRRNGVPLDGATEASLTLSSLTLSDAGFYDVVVSTAGASVTSEAVELRVKTPPAFVVAPTPWATPRVGDSLTLTAEASSAEGGVTYQWKHDNRPIAGATSPQLTLSGLTRRDAGAYTVEATDGNGLVTRATSFVRPTVGRMQVRGWGSFNLDNYFLANEESTIVALSAGDASVLGLREDGTVTAFTSALSTDLPAGLSQVVDIAAGSVATLALRQNGEVVTWSRAFRATEVPAEIREAIAVEQKLDSSLFGAVLDDGRVVLWGPDQNSFTVPADLGPVSALALGGQAVALKVDGTVRTWGGIGSSAPVGLDRVVAVAAGGAHSLALREDGTVVAWGANDFGQSTVPVGLSGVVAISAGANTSFALKADGSLVGWGNAVEASLADRPTDLSGIEAVDAGSRHVAVLRRAEADAAPVIVQPPVSVVTAAGESVRFTAQVTGTGPLVYEWKRGDTVVRRSPRPELWLATADETSVGEYTLRVYNYVGEAVAAKVTLSLATPPTLTSVPPSRLNGRIGESFSLAVIANSPHGALRYQWKKDNRLIAGATTATLTKGNFTNGDAGAYTVEVTDARGLVARATTFVLPDYGLVKVQAFTQSPAKAAVPFGLTGAVAVAGGGSVLTAVTREGRMAVWGEDYSYELLSPDPALTNAVAASVGSYHGVALRDDGTVVNWGRGGTSSPSSRPGAPAALGQGIAVGVDAYSSYALRPDGQVVRWTTAAGVINLVQPESGPYSSFAVSSIGVLLLKTDGTVVFVNTSTSSRSNFLPMPANLSSIVAVAAGEWHFLALRADGTVAAWGDNFSSQATVPAGLSQVVAISAYGNKSIALRADGTAVRWGSTDYYASSLSGEIVAISSMNGGEVALVRTPADSAPVITRAPVEPGLRAVGSMLTLSVEATGSAPFGYQWRRDGMPIAGATSAALTLRSLGLADAGRYDVVVSNHVGATTSAEVALAVGEPPAIVGGNADRRVVAVAGQPLELSFAASSEHGPLAYQWKKNNRPLAGETGATLRLASFAVADAGAYTLEITDTRGLITRVTKFVLPQLGLTRVRAWGSSNSGQFAVPEIAVARTVAVSVGSSQIVALQENGSVVTWGYGGTGRVYAPADLTDVVAVAAGGASFSVVLHSDGRVGELRPAGSFEQATLVYAAVPELSGIIGVAASGSSFLAVHADGSVWRGNFSSSVPA